MVKIKRISYPPLLERIIGNFKSIMYLSLIADYELTNELKLSLNLYLLKWSDCSACGSMENKGVPSAGVTAGAATLNFCTHECLYVGLHILIL